MQRSKMLLSICHGHALFAQALAMKGDVSKAADNERMVAVAEKEFGVLTYRPWL